MAKIVAKNHNHVFLHRPEGVVCICGAKQGQKGKVEKKAEVKESTKPEKSDKVR